MDDYLFASTSMVLLERLRADPLDEDAWGEFVRGYAPAILRWCRGWGLQAADSDDVTQAVLLRLARTMSTFRYDRTKSFRGYLKTLTWYAVCDAVDSLRKRDACADVVDWLEVEDTRNDLARCLEAEFRRMMLEEASARVARRTDASTWEAFRLLARERVAGKEVAERLGITVAAVYMAKSRVVKMLREEIRALSRVLSDLPPSG